MENNLIEKEKHRKVRTVVLGDLHCGHRKALTPRDLFNSSTNIFQEWVIGCWDDFVVRFQNPDYLILNGDLCDGSGAKNMGVECITTSLEEQAGMASRLVQPIVGSKTKIKVISGSGYHTGESLGNNGDLLVSMKLSGEFSGFDFKLALDDSVVHFAHGGSGSVDNPDTVLRREIDRALKMSGKRHEKAPSYIIRSHVHQYVVSGNSAIIGHTAPCWEFSSSYIEKKTSFAVPDIGGLIIDQIDDLILIYPKLYPIPSEIYEGMKSQEVHRTITSKLQYDNRLKAWDGLQKRLVEKDVVDVAVQKSQR